MNKLTEKSKFIIDYFEQAMPDVQSELHYENAYQLLVATMLAAQCTDKRVNMVTPALFEAYPTPLELSKATEEEILALVKSVSYPNSKTAHLSAMSKMLVQDFGGEVPQTMEELTRLPGVGRKTANVVMNCAFGEETFAVDTHVFRVSNRTGLAKGKTPEQVEARLERRVPQPFRRHAHHWLILHGRYTCKARLPECWRCPVVDLCAFKAKVLERPRRKAR